MRQDEWPLAPDGFCKSNRLKGHNWSAQAISLARKTGAGFAYQERQITGIAPDCVGDDFANIQGNCVERIYLKQE